jgi:DHA2 family multidrug resistance protein-like MFS transporter
MLLVIGGIQLATHENLALGISAVIAGVLSAILLVRRERGRANPVLPVDLLAKPVLGLSALAAMACFIATGALMLSLPFRLEEAAGYTPEEVGLLLLPFPLTMLVVAPLAGWMSDRIAPTKLGVTGMTLATIGLFLMIFLPAEPGAVAIAWRLSLTAAGFGLFFAPNSRLLIGQAPRDRTAAAGGLMSTARLLGQAMAAVIVGMLLAAGAGLGPAPLVVSCALCVVAALCSLARFRSVTRAGGTMASLRDT